MLKFFKEKESKQAVGFPPLNLGRALASQALSNGHLETLYTSLSTDFFLLYSMHSLAQLDVRSLSPYRVQRVKRTRQKKVRSRQNLTN